MGEVLLDALLDSLKLLPFLFLMYVLIEILEKSTRFGEKGKLLRGKEAPLAGAAIGLIPQCGFSVMAAKLYDRKFIRTGTVLAVFLATSDEALVLLLTAGDGTAALSALLLLAVKFVYAAAVGCLANAVLFREETAKEESDVHGTACGHEHGTGKASAVKRYLVHPLLHSLEIFCYLLIVNCVFGIMMYYAEDAVTSFLAAGYWYQPLIAALVGLIPNCASSVLITEAYIGGFISFGAMTAGLCANAGLGMVVLFRNTKEWKRNLLFVLALYLCGAALGYIVCCIGLLL